MKQAVNMMARKMKMARDTAEASLSISMGRTTMAPGRMAKEMVMVNLGQEMVLCIKVTG